MVDLPDPDDPARWWSFLIRERRSRRAAAEPDTSRAPRMDTATTEKARTLAGVGRWEPAD